MTETPASFGSQIRALLRNVGTASLGVAERVAENRTANGFDPIAPFDPAAPLATQRRQIAAHNALMDRAVPGRDRICGQEEHVVERDAYRPAKPAGPCVLKEGHAAPRFDDTYRDHMDAAQATRAERYLIHSNPDPDKRA